MENTIVQWNCNGYYSKLTDLKLLLHQYQPKVLCLQETHLAPKNNPILTNYTQYRYDHIEGQRASGGVATFIHNKTYSKQINIQTELQAITTQIHITEKEILTICNIYIPPNTPFTADDLRLITRQIPRPFILLGDLNTHTTLIGSNYTNQRGLQIEQFLLNNPNVSILNDGSPTHFSPIHGFSCIDVTMATNNLKVKLDWKTHEDLCFSDHYPIIIKYLPQYHSKQTFYTTKYNYEAVDWEKYKDITMITTNDETELKTIEEKLDILTDTIYKAIEVYVPKTTTIHKNKQVPWWSNTIKLLLKERTKFLKKYKLTGLQIFLEKYRMARAKARREIISKKKECWNTFVQSINTESTTKELWSNIKKIKIGTQNTERLNALRIQNAIILDPKTIAEEFAAHYSHTSSDQQYNQEFLAYKTQTESTQIINFESNEQHTYNSKFEYHEYTIALYTVKNKACGPDDIPIICIQNLNQSALEFLFRIINNIWELGEIPKSWKTSTIVPILKPQKDKLDPSSYRPISLINHMAKVMERMVYNRLAWILETQQHLNSRQYGFRPNRSTLDCHTILDTDIKNALITKQNLYAIFFDINKAFDTTWRHKILRQLKNWNMAGNLPKYIKNFLNTRAFQVKISKCTSEKHIQKNGIPQGSVLSTLLFAIAVNDITNTLPYPIQTIIYADDLLTYTITKDPENATRYLQIAIDNLVSWSKHNGLQFSETKTKHICFHKTQKHNIRLNMNNRAIETTTKHKFLGLTYEEKLTWKSHISILKAELIPRINIFKILSNKNTGSDRKTLTTIYNAIIKSKIDYGSHIYGSAKKTVLKQLDTINNSALRIITGAYRTSPILSLYCDAGIPTLSESRNLQYIKYYFSTLQKPNPDLTSCVKPNLHFRKYENKKSYPKPFNIQINKILEINHIPAEIEPLKIQTIEENPPWHKWHIELDLKLNELPKQTTLPIIYQHSFLERIGSKYKNFRHIYTDGSKTETGTACAYIKNDSEYKYKLNNIATNYTAEGIAIKKAMENIPEDRNHHKKNVIISDSLSVLQAINNPYTKNALIQQIQVLYHQLENRGITIFFLWIPGHVGITNNEKADEAAKEATLNGTPTPEITTEDIIKYAKKQLLTHRTEIWQNTPQSKLKIIKTESHTWATSHQSDRKFEVALARLRIGHTKATHSYLLEKTQQPQCPTCATPITVEHLLITCKDYENIRKKHQLPETVKDLLSDNHNTINALKNYITETNILNTI